MFRKGVFDSVGHLDENLKKAQDVDFYIRVLKEYYIQGIDDILYQKYEEQDRITANPDRRIQGETRILNKHTEVLTPKHKAKRYDSRGVAYGKNGDMKNATADFVRAIQCYPYLWYTYYHLDRKSVV